MDYLAEAKKAIEVTHRCIATHVETVPVHEVFKGKTVWDGDVEVFAVANHPKAKRAYAWGYANEKRGGKFDFVIVLEIPPVTSPQTAVKAAVAAHGRSKLSPPEHDQT